MRGLMEVLRELVDAGVQGSFWIDGSFVTEKIDPDDVDCVLRLEADFYDNANTDQQKAIDWLDDDLATTHHCDTYNWMEWTEQNPNYWVGEYFYAYWLKQFGFSRADQMKGIAVIELNGRKP